jgi:glyoxylate utilization-related uncharacterized protein
MSIKLSRVSLSAGANATYRGSHSMIYVMTGAVTVTVAGDRRLARPEEGAYLPPAPTSSFNPPRMRRAN